MPDLYVVVGVVTADTLPERSTNMAPKPPPASTSGTPTPSQDAATRMLQQALGPIPPWVMLVALVLGYPLSGLLGGKFATQSYVTRDDLAPLIQKVDTLDQKITDLRIAIAVQTQKDPG